MEEPEPRKERDVEEGQTEAPPQDLEGPFTIDAGSIEVQFEVEGRISRQHVEGSVATGQEATIIAGTGSGGIDVLQY